MKRQVALFSTQFCPYSQTFVWDEVTSHIRYSIDVFTNRRLYPDRFPYDHIYTMQDAGSVEQFLNETVLFSPTRTQLMKQGNYDLIAAHFGPGSMYALPHAQRTGLPLIVTYHGFDVPLLKTWRRFNPAYWRYWLLSPWMFKRVDRFLAASDELHRMLVELGAPRDKVFTWRLGVRIPEMKQPETTDTHKLIQVGRFVEKKGYIYTLKALVILREMWRAEDRPFDVSLKCIGDGPLLNECKAFVKKSNLDQNVEFIANIPQAEVFKQIEEADILLCPSVVAKNGDRESGILVAKEAAARFKPVIGTQHGGIPEIINDHVTGYIVSERNPDAIAARLNTLLTNPALRLEMGIAARHKMETEFRLEKRVQILEEHYDEVIDLKKKQKSH